MPYAGSTRCGGGGIGTNGGNRLGRTGKAMRIRPEKIRDTEVCEHHLLRVTMYANNKGERCAEFGFDGSCGICAGPIDFTPKVGQTIRLYGRGFGSPVRGIDVNGREIYYRTEAEDEERHREWCLN